MAWRTATLGQFLGPVNILANDLTLRVASINSNVAIIKSVLNLFLSKSLTKINKINNMLDAFEADGYYAITLSETKGSWNTRMAIAPNAPPEGKSHYTTGICVIAADASPDDFIERYTNAMSQLDTGVSNFKLNQLQMQPPENSPAISVKTKITDVWYTATLGDMLPGLFKMAHSACSEAIGFIANLQYALGMIDLFTSTSSTLTNAAASFIDDLNSAGVYVIVLPPKAMGIMERLTTELHAPPTSSKLYTAGFCVCNYTTDLLDATKKYNSLLTLVDPDIESDLVTPDYPELRSWAIPPGGYFDRETYVYLHCNIAKAKIYYTKNGTNPRTSELSTVYSSDTPIHITENNTVVRFFAKDSNNVERVIREELYRIVEVPYGVPYTEYGVVPNTPEDWGTREMCLDPGFDNSIYPETKNDPGGKNIDGDPLPDDTVIPPDYPMKQSSALAIDIDAGIAPEDIMIGYSYGENEILFPVVKIAQYGSEPWGKNGFPDEGAWWIWAEEGADVSAVTNQPLLFRIEWNNGWGPNLPAKLVYMADNTAICILNNEVIDTDTGWYELPGSNPVRYVGSYAIQNGFRVCDVSLKEGINTLTFIVTNWEGAAGLIFSVLDEFTSNIYVRSNEEVLCTRPDWYTNFLLTERTQNLEALTTTVIDVYYGQNCNILVDFYGKKISSILTDDYGLEISEDSCYLSGVVNFVSNVTIRVLMEDNSKVDVVFNVLFVTKDIAGDISPVVTDIEISTTKGSAVDITLIGEDPNGADLKYRIITSPSHGFISGVPPLVSYKPSTTYIGTDTFTYIAYNYGSKSLEGTVTITINEPQ